MDKKEKSLKLIDVSTPNDVNIVLKRIEKIEKYANLSIELKELLGMKNYSGLNSDNMRFLIPFKLIISNLILSFEVSYGNKILMK